MSRFRIAASVAALLAMAGPGSVLAEEKGWYIGAGAGYASGEMVSDSFTQQVSTLIPGTSITNDTNGLMYKIFLGYSFTSFIALEANAFWLNGLGADATNPSIGTLTGSVESWGFSLDVLGIIPLGENWRIFGRAGGLYTESTTSLGFTGGGLTGSSRTEEYKGGYKFGAGVGYEFASGVAFRAEWEQYHLLDAILGEENLVVDAYSASFLYRFK